MSEYHDPYSLQSRGIKRLSVVYGIVPVQADGTPFKESANWPYDKCPSPDTPRRVAKGVVARADKVQDGWIDVAKVAWQRHAVGRAALSRGIGRWPLSIEIFTAAEVIDAIKTNPLTENSEEYGTTPDLPNHQGAIDELDKLIERSPLANAALHHVLSGTSISRQDHAWAIYKKS